MFKVIKGVSPSILKDVFPLKESNIYASRFPFKTRNVRTVAYGTETLGHLGPKIWSIVPEELKNANDLNDFKNKIKLWRPQGCPCRLCKTYISEIGFVNCV